MVGACALPLSVLVAPGADFLCPAQDSAQALDITAHGNCGDIRIQRKELAAAIFLIISTHPALPIYGEYAQVIMAEIFSPLH